MKNDEVILLTLLIDFFFKKKLIFIKNLFNRSIILTIQINLLWSLIFSFSIPLFEFFFFV